jgi:hypothetical protein
MNGVFSAICTKEIYWSGKTYRRGATILVEATSVEQLRSAGVIGDIKRAEVEMATKDAPEDAAQNYRRRSR